MLRHTMEDLHPNKINPQRCSFHTSLIPKNHSACTPQDITAPVNHSACLPQDITRLYTTGHYSTPVNHSAYTPQDITAPVLGYWWSDRPEEGAGNPGRRRYGSWSQGQTERQRTCRYSCMHALVGVQTQTICLYVYV